MGRVRFVSYPMSSLDTHKMFKDISFHLKMGRVGLEPTYTEVGGFTVRCNCHYATYPYDNKQKKIYDNTLSRYYLFSFLLFKVFIIG